MTSKDPEMTANDKVRPAGKVKPAGKAVHMKRRRKWHGNLSWPAPSPLSMGETVLTGTAQGRMVTAKCADGLGPALNPSISTLC